MKKNLRILALAAALCLSLCACGGDASAPESQAPAETTPAVPETTTPVESEAPEVSATPVELGGSIETENFKMTFNSLGNARAAIIVAVVRKFVLLIPLIYVMPLIFSSSSQMQTTAIYMAEPIADFIAVTFTAVLFFFQFKKSLAALDKNVV